MTAQTLLDELRRVKADAEAEFHVQADRAIAGKGDTKAVSWLSFALEALEDAERWAQALAEYLDTKEDARGLFEPSFMKTVKKGAPTRYAKAREYIARALAEAET